MNETAPQELARLLDVMVRLRKDCPWDRKQDHRSLRPYLVEEVYEVLDALDDGVPADLREELGDLLFQIVFHSHLASERGEFDLAGVVRGITEKLRSRHPHVFGTSPPIDAEAALRSWAAIKLEERKAKGIAEPSALDGVPTKAPALLRAERIGEKAARMGFDWTSLAGVRAKLTEELAELDEAVGQGNLRRIEEELGDVLFSLCNLARWLETPAEDALRGTIRRFEARFRWIEDNLRGQGRSPLDCQADELGRLWGEAKVALNRQP
ncbi:MAG: nucleoside triphosphate pyrophosphohydrolase [Deltaproteobacteria bacterium]